jgi:hypothetical protein
MSEDQLKTSVVNSEHDSSSVATTISSGGGTQQTGLRINAHGNARPKRTTIMVKNDPNDSHMDRIKSFNMTRARASIMDREANLKKIEMMKAKKKKNDAKFNFVVGSGEQVKRYRFEDVSLMLFDRTSRFRQAFVRILAHPWFETFILTMIMVNALFFSMADYTNVDESGNIVEEGSVRNYIIIRTNVAFLVIFTAEFVIKAIAQGFYGSHGAYLDDAWNILDFIVVVTSLLVAAVPDLPSISSLRLIRILRPLRSLTMLPGLRDIVKSIFASIPELAGVFSLMSFVFLVFAIAGIELFGGASSHARCRATPYPVNTTYQFSVHGSNYAPYRCIPGSTLSTIDDDTTLTKSTSPWATTQDCYWPLSEANSEYEGIEFSRTCSLDGSGMNTCISDVTAVDESLWSWCGSNFDAYGNRRFSDFDHFGTSNPTGKDMYRNGKYVYNDRDMFIGDLNYGYTNFDSFGTAIITIFQVITEEGWTHILYMNMDSYGKSSASMYFTLIILMGCFFVLQLLLAVLEDNFHSAKEEVKRQEAEARAQVLAVEEAEKKAQKKRNLVVQSSNQFLTIVQNKRKALAGPTEKSADRGRRLSSFALQKWGVQTNSKKVVKVEVSTTSAAGGGDDDHEDGDASVDNSALTNDDHSGGFNNTSTDNSKPIVVGDNMDLSQPNESRAASHVDNDSRAEASSKSASSWTKKLTSVLSTSFRVMSGGSSAGDSETTAISKDEILTGSHISRLEHITAEEIFGDACVTFVEDNFYDVYDHIVQVFRDAKKSVIKCFEKEVDLTAPKDETYWDKLVAASIIAVDWEYFDLVSGVMILVNCVTLMADHYPMETEVGSALDISNAILTMIFTMEMVLLLTAKGPSAYTKDALSTFDAFVVLASLVDLSLSPPAAFGDTGVDISKISAISSVISMMRCFRLFRMIKLAIRVKSLKTLFFRVAKTFMDLSSYMILLMVLILIYTVAGLQFFANKFRFDINGDPITAIYSDAWLNAYDVARYNFDDFSSSFGTVFQIITTENWNDILYNVWRVYGPFGILFPMSLVLGGTFILMNLFLGILLSNFKGTGEEERAHAAKDDADHDDDDDDSSDSNSPKERSKPKQIVSVEDERLAVYLEERKEKQRKSMLRRKSVSGGLRGPATPNALALSPAKVAPLPTTVEGDNGGGATESMGEGEKSEPQSPTWTKSLLDSVSSMVDSLSPSKNKVTPLPQDDVEEGTTARRVVEMPTATTSKSHEAQRQSPSFVHQADLDDLDDMEELDEDSVFPLLAVNTLLVMSPENNFRVFCAHILDHKWFETVIQTLILLSSISLAIDSPLDDPNSSFRDGMYYFEIFTTTIFTIECLLKVVVFGFSFHEGAYLRSGWNVLDFIIVVISVMTFFELSESLSALKSIRSLRALRPLRVISRAPGLRTIVNAVFDSIPDVINVLAVVLVCFSIFAVVSVNFLKGDLRHCANDHFETYIATNASAMSILENPVPWASMTDSQKLLFSPDSNVSNFTTSDCSEWSSGGSCCPNHFPSSYDEEITSRMMCECWGGEWEAVAYITFDNYPEALMGYFMISTTEGWVDLMYAAVDSTGVDMQPVRNSNYLYVYFYVLFIISGNFFALNLFVGVMIDNFEKTKFAMQGDLIFMSKEQQEWIKASAVVNAIKPHVRPIEPKDRLGKLCYHICESHEFEVGIIICIFINTLILSMGYFGISDLMRVTFENMNSAFAYLFTLEMFIKLVGLRWVYFNSVWNQFDFAVTVGSDIGILYFLITGERGAMAVMIVRIFRVLRVVRLMEGLETAKRLLDTLMLTLPGILNISLLLMLILFIYAVLGMQLFAKTAYNGSYSTHSNFRTFENSLLTLVRFATGEGWGNFMFDASVSVDGCVNDPDYDESMCGFTDDLGCVDLNGCGSIAVFPFLLSFTLFVSMVLFNLFVGVIIEGFQEANDQSKSLRNEDYAKFCEYWAKFDPEATCLMSVEHLEEFLATLPAPFGLGDKHPTHNETIRFTKELDLELYSIRGYANYVYFKDVMFALMTRRIELHKEVNLQDMKGKINENDDSTNTKRNTKEISKVNGFETDSGTYTLKEHYAALLMQRAIKRAQGTDGNRLFELVSELVEQSRTTRALRKDKDDSEGKRDFSFDSNSVPAPLSNNNSVDVDSEHSISPVNK